MAPSGHDFLFGNPNASTALEYCEDLHERQNLALENNRCYVSSCAAPHAPIVEVLDAMDEAADICEAQARKGKRRIDPENVAILLRDWHTKLRDILADLNMAEEQRTSDVFKAIDWYNRNLAQQETQLLGQSNSARYAMEQRCKRSLAAKDLECSQSISAYEAEITSLKEEIYRLRHGASAKEETAEDLQEDNLFVEMLVDGAE